MSSPSTVPGNRASSDNGKDSPTKSLYQHFLAIREEVLRHKWLKSEEAGEDVGFEAALVDWMKNNIDEENGTKE